MPVIINQLSPVNANLPGYAVAQALAKQAIVHFDAVRGTVGDIGPAAGCAAFAVVASSQFPAITNHNYGMTFGHSVIVPDDPDAGPIDNHAERSAIITAGDNQLQPVTPNAVLFAELAPCPACVAWLAGNGEGTANPYNFGLRGGNLYTWFVFPYHPNGLAAMTAFHATSVNEQLAVASTW